MNKSKVRSSRFSPSGTLVALLALVAGIAVTVEAGAHHPGSHASVLEGGEVRLEIATPVTDGCTQVGSVTLGAPAGMTAPSGSEAVTVRLSRPAQAACAQVVSTAHEQIVLPQAIAAKVLHLFILNSDGSLHATERVNVR